MAKPTKQTTKKQRTLETSLPWILFIGGAVGIFASFVITYEKFKLLVNPDYHPSCSINPIISCGSVMSSHQASVFGFPNSFMGLIGFGVIIATGAALLAGAKLKRWYWLGLQLGTFLALLFCHWLFFQSVYRIHALCPYCISVWFTTITCFWYTLLYNLRVGHIRTNTKVSGWLQRHHGDILFTWIGLIILAIGIHFWYFWKTLV